MDKRNVWPYIQNLHKHILISESIIIGFRNSIYGDKEYVCAFAIQQLPGEEYFPV